MGLSIGMADIRVINILNLIGGDEMSISAALLQFRKVNEPHPTVKSVILKSLD
jgi:hypothetical protein